MKLKELFLEIATCGGIPLDQQAADKAAEELKSNHPMGPLLEMEIPPEQVERLRTILSEQFPEALKSAVEKVKERQAKNN